MRSVPARTIRRIYNKFIPAGSVNDENSKRKHHLLKEEKLDDIVINSIITEELARVTENFIQ